MTGAASVGSVVKDLILHAFRHMWTTNASGMHSISLQTPPSVMNIQKGLTEWGLFCIVRLPWATVTMHPRMSQAEEPHPLAMIAHLASEERIVVELALWIIMRLPYMEFQRQYFQSILLFTRTMVWICYSKSLNFTCKCCWLTLHQFAYIILLSVKYNYSFCMHGQHLSAQGGWMVPSPCMPSISLDCCLWNGWANGTTVPGDIPKLDDDIIH